MVGKTGDYDQSRRRTPFVGFFRGPFTEEFVRRIPSDDFTEKTTDFLDARFVQKVETSRFRSVVVRCFTSNVYGMANGSMVGFLVVEP